MFRTKPGEERALIEDWINRPALRKLVETYGGTWPAGDLETVVAELVDFSAIWDYRAGRRDRHLFHDDHDVPDPHTELTYWAAEELGMMNPPPPSQPSYDYLLVLGGLATGVEPRVQYAAQLMENGLEVRLQVAALGSFRPLQERELPISSRYAPHGRYEIDHLLAMLADLFHADGSWSRSQIGDPDTDPALSSLTATLTRPEGPELGAFAAASSDPDTRPANTSDTYLYLAETNRFDRDQRLLVITSAIYLPYQHLDAVRALRPFGLDIETVGVRRDRLGPTHTASAYRQEVRSALRSARRGLLSPHDL